MRAPFQPSSKKTDVQVPFIKDREIVQVRNPSCQLHKTHLLNPITEFAMLHFTRDSIWAVGQRQTSIQGLC